MLPRAVFAACGRCLLGLAASTMLLPATGWAQGARPAAAGPGSGLRITPFVGWATAVTREETWTYDDGTGNRVHESVDMDLAGGPAAGAIVEFPFWGPIHLLAGATFVDRDDAEFSVAGARWVFTGSRNIMVKLGAGLELRDPENVMTVRRLAAGVFVAPFYLLEAPKKISSIEDPDLFDTAHHFGLNFGLSGELPFARDRFALQVGFEDYLTIWNEGRLQRLPDWLHDAPASSATRVDADLTHQWLVRAGLALRLH